ncbi:glycosyl hydrolase family 18 protein [Sphingomonas bacterium]|uniref:glycosyl hydrolase family 18 protein n=1 Tax=Sphingomonas bacterium TaxID=1895847 RepID=UPI001575AE30|nr:glycosyl hydrolase family 18 protein [Sphingomonas bacterium]
MPFADGLAALPARNVLARYSHVTLAFANPDAGGNFVINGAMACAPGPRGATTGLAALRDAVARVHRAKAKALISVAGGVIPGCAGDWTVLLQPRSRDAIVAGIVALADEAGVDGVDVDLEGALLTSLDQAGGYTPFVAALAAALKRQGKLLTCATASYEGGMVPVTALRWFDYVSVMSYDAVGPGWGRPGDEHAPYDKAVADVKLWRDRGVPRRRLVLGLPYYGYGYGGYAATYAYRDILATFGAQAAADVVGTRCAGCGYITQNGPATLARKAALAREQAAGVMVWEITQDTEDGQLGLAVSTALASRRGD